MLKEVRRVRREEQVFRLFLYERILLNSLFTLRSVLYLNTVQSNISAFCGNFIFFNVYQI